MQKRSVSRILVAVIPTILVVAVTIMMVSFVPTGASAVAQSDRAQSGRPCSNRTLLGDYGFAVEGLVLPAPGVAIPGRGVTMTHFDGEGLSLHQRRSGKRLESCHWYLSGQCELHRNDESRAERRRICKPAHRGGETWDGNPHRGLAAI
jgi:hypothetical protein